MYKYNIFLIKYYIPYLLANALTCKITEFSVFIEFTFCAELRRYAKNIHINHFNK